jgi:predicted dehydrogenase
MAKRPVRLGMIGGGQGAFIGAVHRLAAALDGSAEVVAGCLSSTPERARASGAALGLAAERTYGTWMQMLEREGALPPERRVELVSIVTPNHAHAAPAIAFARAGFHVVCDKPLAATLAEGEAVAAAVRESGTLFAVTYNYSGYPMVRQAAAMVRGGEIGTVRKVVAQYHQGWLATNLEATGQKQAAWRTDPKSAGAGALGDIGSHAEQLICTVTGLRVSAVCADVRTHVSGRRVDDDAGVLLRLRGEGAGEGDVPGVLSVSQVAVGHENDLRLMVAGTAGSLLWAQEEPNALRLLREGEERVMRRGHGGLSVAAGAATRLPGGHPEGFIEAFANVYRGVCDAVRARSAGEPVGADAPARFGYPGVDEGVRGLRFIERVVQNARGTHKWTSVEA